MKVKVFSCLTILIFLAISLIAVPVILLCMGLESTPLVVQGERLSIDDMEEIKQKLKEHNPRKLRDGEVNSIVFTERELNLFLVHILTYLPHSEKISGSVSLNEESADANLTLVVPENPFGVYANISTVLATQSRFITVEDLHLGALKMPNWLVCLAGRHCHKLLLRRQDYRELVEGLDYVKDIQIDEDKLALVYQWEPEVADRIQSHGRDLLIPDEDKERLLAYHNELAALSHTFDSRRVSLAELLQPLARLAEERSNIGDPVAENRALFLVMAIYVMKKDLTHLTGSNGKDGLQRAQRLKVTLSGRHDLGQHFIISAAVAASANSNTANVIGLFKEIDDSRIGSGFSFADLAADRAGVKLAELATTSPESAKILQHNMKENLTESDFMPSINNLPEGIMKHEFKQKYGDLESEAYQLVDQEIYRRLAVCRLLQ